MVNIDLALEVTLGSSRCVSYRLIVLRNLVCLISAYEAG